MKKKIGITTIILIMFSGAYADEPTSVKQGAQEYDWQTCISSKIDACVNTCTTSEDPNCSDNCNATAKDKCLSEGVSPPPQ